MKNIIFAMCLFLGTWLSAQSPYKFNYQAVARNAQGAPLSNQSVKVRISILDGTSTGTVQYSETHQASTNALGHFNLAVGGGSVITGNLAQVTWSNGDKYIQVELDPNGGNNFVLMGTSQLLSVPYALFAEQPNIIAGNGIAINKNVISNSGDADNDATNELQQLSLNNGVLSLTKGNSIDLPKNTTSIQAGPGIDVIQNGNSYTINNSGDTDAQNELQQLSIVNNEISISKGNKITIPTGGTPTVPSYTTSQILNLSNKAPGNIVLNTDDNALYYYSGNNWYKLDATILSNPGGNIVTDCLVAYYDFDDATVSDAFGDYEGINSGCTFSNDVNSKINSGKSIYFDGTDRITVPKNPLYNLNTGSISFWYKGTADGMILIGTTKQFFSAFHIRTYANLGKRRLEFNSSTSFSFDVSALTQNTWRHCVVTISGTEAKLYIDGNFIESFATTLGMHDTSKNEGMLIGSYEGNSTYNLVGYLDNLRIYCKPLTENEVKLLYNNGK